VLHALLTECSVSNAARRLNQSQPAVSTALRRLRDITGDQLLVRSRNGMTPTERGAGLLEPVKIALQQIVLESLSSVERTPNHGIASTSTLTRVKPTSRKTVTMPNTCLITNSISRPIMNTG
jgi:DNA-binding transcriptional LysR family regulator